MNPTLYHIVHLDRMAFILNDQFLYSDRIVTDRKNLPTTIGMEHIKKRRLYELQLGSYPDLFVGDCVPFYFCPRSVMLYVIHKKQSKDIRYKGGQNSIVHLVTDFASVTNWAKHQGLRWAFTSSNAGSEYFTDYSEQEDLKLLKWDSIETDFWAGEHKEGKQAEFLIEQRVPWSLIQEIGVFSDLQRQHVLQLLQNVSIPIKGVNVRRQWYY